MCSFDWRMSLTEVNTNIRLEFKCRNWLIPLIHSFKLIGVFCLMFVMLWFSRFWMWSWSTVTTEHAPCHAHPIIDSNSHSIQASLKIHNENGYGKKKRKSKKNEETLQPVRIIYSIVYRVYAQVKKAYHLNDHLFLISRYAYRTKEKQTWCANLKWIRNKNRRTVDFVLILNRWCRFGKLLPCKI